MITEVNERLDVNFEYWECELTASELRKWGSPHFHWKERGEAVRDIFRCRAARDHCGGMTFTRNAIAVANHAYPEAALVDPVADLELWEEWRQGLREFPYLGRYAPLGIFHQAGKTSSTSSVGVLGEVLAGRVAEAFIAPAVLVRVVRRWPDFILLAQSKTGPGRFVFLESKAIGPDGGCKGNLCGGDRVPEPQFLALADQVVQQLNADPFIEVWGAFTYVRSISPMQVAFTLIRFLAGEDKRIETPRAGIPAPVLSGLAERCLGAAVALMGDDERSEFLVAGRQDRRRKHAEGRLVEMALGEFRIILRDEIRNAVAFGDEEVAPYVEKALRRLQTILQLPGKRTREARAASEGSNVLVPIGSIGGQHVYMVNLPDSDERQLALHWKADWSAAARAWDVQKGIELWRSGGALFAVGDRQLAGTTVSPKYPVSSGVGSHA